MLQFCSVLTVVHRLLHRANVSEMSNGAAATEKNACSGVQKAGDNVNDSRPKQAKIEKPYSGHCAPASRARASVPPSSVQKELKVYIFNSNRGLAGGSPRHIMGALCKVLFDNWSRPGPLFVCGRPHSSKQCLGRRG